MAYFDEIDNQDETAIDHYEHDDFWDGDWDEYEERQMEDDDGQPDEYTEWQDVFGGDDWDHGQFDDYDY